MRALILKMYVVCIKKNRLDEAIQISTHNILLFWSKLKRWPYNASWPGSIFNPQWLELPPSRTNFHSPIVVQPIKVRLYAQFGLLACLKLVKADFTVFNLGPAKIHDISQSYTVLWNYANNKWWYAYSYLWNTWWCSFGSNKICLNKPCLAPCHHTMSAH